MHFESLDLMQNTKKTKGTKWNSGLRCVPLAYFKGLSLFLRKYFPKLSKGQK